MKRILLARHNLRLPQGELDFDQVELLRLVASAPLPGEGFQVQDMRLAVRVLDLLDDLPPALDRGMNWRGHVDLEDADHAWLAQRLERFPFNFAHRALLAFVDGVLEAKAPPAAAAELAEAAA